MPLTLQGFDGQLYHTEALVLTKGLFEGNFYVVLHLPTADLLPPKGPDHQLFRHVRAEVIVTIDDMPCPVEESAEFYKVGAAVAALCKVPSCSVTRFGYKPPRDRNELGHEVMAIRVPLNFHTFVRCHDTLTTFTQYVSEMNSYIAMEVTGFRLRNLNLENNGDHISYLDFKCPRNDKVFLTRRSMLPHPDTMVPQMATRDIRTNVIHYPLE